IVMRVCPFPVGPPRGRISRKIKSLRPTPERPCSCWNRPRPRVRVVEWRLDKPDRPFWQGVSPVGRLAASLLEKTTDCRIGLEADRALIGLRRRGVIAGEGEQLRARRPIGLIVG